MIETMSITWVLGLVLVTSLVSAADRTQQEVSNDVDRKPVLCSTLPTLSVEPQQLIGDWLIKQSLLFNRGVIIPEDALEDQQCFDVCWKFSVKPHDDKLAVKSITYVKSKNMTTDETVHVETRKESGRFNVVVPGLQGKGLELVVVSGNPTSHFIVAKCRPLQMSSKETAVQVLDNLSLLSRTQSRRGQSVFTVQELQAQVEMLKLVGLSEVQWSVPYDTTC